MDFLSIISLLGGVAFFLYGMSVMGTGLKRIAGNKMETYLWHLSSTTPKAFLLGVFATAVVQSSSATSVMVVSFVNAGMMKLAQAVCVIIGANIGTTMTSWILSLSSGSGALAQILSPMLLVCILAVVGILIHLFAKRNSVKNIGVILVGLGLLLLSMDLIGDAVEPLKQSEAFQHILVLFKNPLLGILAGIVVAAIVQSASAGVGILQALCITGALPYSVCLPLILGINVGASVPVLLSMLGSTRDGKRAALTYLVTNVLGIPIIYILYVPIRLITGLPIMDTASTVLGIAILNTLLRVVIAAVLLPLHRVIEKILYRLLPRLPGEQQDEEEIDRLTESLLNYAPMAIEQSEIAAVKMATLAKENLLRSLSIVDKFDRGDFNLIQEKEALVDKYEDKLGNYIVKISKNELDTAQQAAVSEMLGAIGDFERLSDHAANLSEVAEEIAEKHIEFSEDAQQEITLLINAVTEIVNLAIEAFSTRNLEHALQVEPLEEVVDQMCKILRVHHTERVQKNTCTIVTGFVFNDLLTNLERVADHCSNIAFSVMHRNNLNAEGHEFTESLAHSPEFRVRFDTYREKYLAQIK